jgi:hypothetical protein
MVTGQLKQTRRIFWAGTGLAVFLLAMPFLSASAAVIASVDRIKVELNESFTLKVLVDTAIDVEPRADALEKDFFVGSRSQLSNTTIVNGQITRSRTWTYVLMARRAGNLLIPPIFIGTEQSEAVNITVVPQSKTAPGESDIFVSADVDFKQSYVQAQILYTVKVYRAVATRQPRLAEPEMNGVDVLVEVAGEERSYESLLNGKSYNVVERIYALFPQESGEINIEPARFEARVLRDGRITGRKVFQSEAIAINVKPIPPPPSQFGQAAWLPARSVTLSEEWSREPDSLPVGEPITRRLKVTALGQLSTQIPFIDVDVSDSIKIYPDKPELQVRAVDGGILASRTDQYAMIGVVVGPVELPEIQLPWWDIGAGEWKIATLPKRTISILPSADAAVLPVTPQPGIANADDSAGTVVIHSKFWRLVSEVLAGVWILTVLAWWWSGRPKKAKPASEEPPIHKQQSQMLRQARKAAQAGDTVTVKSALLKWGRLQWPDNAPLSIGELAIRVTAPLDEELERLSRGTYGPSAVREWDGTAFAKALRSFALRKDTKEQPVTDSLPPLMPSPPT